MNKCINVYTSTVAVTRMQRRECCDALASRWVWNVARPKGRRRVGVMGVERRGKAKDVRE